MSTVIRVRRALGIVVAVMVLVTGCEMKPEVPPRLPGISPTAVWAGWVDGGAWIECWFDPSTNANWCTVWDDQTGQVIARTHYVLRAKGTGVPDHELKYLSFNGTDIELQDGRYLEPRRKTQKDLPAVESARGRPSR